MRKLTFLIIATFIATMGFAQEKLQNTSNLQSHTAETGNFNPKAVTGTLANCGERYGYFTSFEPAPVGIASRFEANQLTEYVGQYITKIGLYVGSTAGISSARIAVLGGTINSPVILTEQSFTPVVGTNEISFQTPYQIEAETPIMIAYEWVTTAGCNFHTDAGPAVTGGDLMSFTNGIEGSFLSVYNSLGASFNMNFYIYAIVEDEISNETNIIENQKSGISIFPNPGNNIVTIANAEGLNITVVNSLGQVVSNIENASANQTIDVSNFAKGTYFVKVNSEVLKLNIIK